MRIERSSIRCPCCGNTRCNKTLWELKAQAQVRVVGGARVAIRLYENWKFVVGLSFTARLVVAIRLYENWKLVIEVSKRYDDNVAIRLYENWKREENRRGVHRRPGCNKTLWELKGLYLLVGVLYRGGCNKILWELKVVYADVGWFMSRVLQ